MDLSVRPFAAVLVRAQLLLGAAGCAAEPPPTPSVPAAPAEPEPAVEAPPLVDPPPVVTSPPPIAELAEPEVVVKKRVVPDKVVVPPPDDKIVVPDPIVPDPIVPDPIDRIRVAPTCGPCCHGSSDCNKLIAPPIDR